MAVVPRKTADLAALAKRCMAAWAENNTLTLQWITRVEAQSKVDEYYQKIIYGEQSKIEQRAIANNLQALDNELNKGLEKLKKLIQLDHSGHDIGVHYAQYGIQRYKRTYRLPRDRDERLQALEILVAKLATASFKDHANYGTAFWSSRLDTYRALKTQLETQAGATSSVVGDKATTKVEIRKLIFSLKKLVEANYPDNAEAMLRQWGFQDERN